MEQPINKQIVFEHFAGRTSPLQRRLLEEWLKTSLHQESYYEWLEEWEHQNLQYVTDTDQALQANLLQIDEQLVEESKPVQRFWFTVRRLSIAAVVLLCLGVGFYLIQDFLFYKTFETSYGQVRQIQLSDGTLVTLNAHSTLQVPRFGFGKKSRQVFLTGEADFDVRHLPDNQPFQIKIERGFNVTVLGTKFTVYARSRKTQLVLKSGKVQIDYDKGSKHLLMKPGQLVRMNRQGQLSLQHIRSPKPYDAWKEYRYEFDRTSLKDISYLLQENYGLEVTIKDTRLANETTSGSYQARTADELLQLISQLFEINYNRQNNHVTFSQ
ncbi:MAG: FecR domain-containing protein [Siphonobacter sp.]